MTSISDIPGAGGWRASYQQAMFRNVIFYVETDARQGGRRVAVHEYPKRSVPYAEDMGKKANRWVVQGYLIGHDAWSDVHGSDMPQANYLDMKDQLIAALEADGPGWLRLPMPYLKKDVYVMVQQYAVTESRERGGMCVVEMDFIEYGDPNYRGTTLTAAAIMAAATALESTALQVATDTTSGAAALASSAVASVASYYQTYFGSGVSPVPVLRPTGAS